MKKITLLLSALISAISLYASSPLPIYQDESRPIDERVEDALRRLTTQEKINMIHAQGKFSSPGVARLGIPDLWMSDGPHGVRMEINWSDWKNAGRTNDSVTAFPALTALAATWNPALAADYGNALGEEALYREKDVILGPGVNIYRTPLNGRNFEYFGEDPYLSSTMVVPYIRGMQQNGVAACVKHFALNNQEKWRGHIDVRLSDRALHEIYLPAFKSAVVDGDVWTIMGAYNKVRGQHACHNDFLLNKLLKEEWGFQGVVITDWGGAHDTREAALNGLDLEMGTYTNGLTSESTFTTDDYYLARPYLELIESGELPLSTLDDKVRRLLRLNFLTAMNRSKSFGSLASPEHYKVAEEIGNEAIVLLKNSQQSITGKPLLPIEPGSGKILVVGDNATRNLMKGGGSSELKAKDIVTPLDGLRELWGDRVEYAQGYEAGKPMYGHVEVIAKSVQDSLRAEALAKAREAETIIFIGGLNKNHGQDCEGGDRESLALPYGQDSLITALREINPRTIVVLLSGNAVEMPWVDDIDAIVQGWYLGSMAGKSIASVLSGRVNPSGKLPFTFPKKLADNSSHYFGEISYPGDSIMQRYDDDIFVGYRWHDSRGIEPLFPFGHGLSYTRFDYGEPKLSSSRIPGTDSVTVTIPIRNIGSVAGKEIVQLYIGDDKSSLPRPVKELKGFEKVSLMPGEEKSVTFTVKPEHLMFYNDQPGKWMAEPGSFTLSIGSSSADIRATASVTLL